MKTLPIPTQSRGSMFPVVLEGTIGEDPIHIGFVTGDTLDLFLADYKWFARTAGIHMKFNVFIKTEFVGVVDLSPPIH